MHNGRNYDYIRAGSGLGDSLYLQAVCRHMVAQGRALTACTNYPEIFAPLEGKIEVQPFKREGVGIVAHYTMRRNRQETTQFVDCCIQGGLVGDVELKLDWHRTKEYDFGDRPIAVVGLPRAPMGRTDGMAIELLPNMAAYQSLVDEMRARGFLIVQVGSGDALYKLELIDIDLANKTTVTELIDIVSLSDAVVCYPSFLIPMAESLGKPYVTMFSTRGLTCHKSMLRQITPCKLIHRKDLGTHIMDNQPNRIANVVDAHFFR